MKLSIFQWHLLKTRVTLLTLAIFLIGLWSLAFYASSMLRRDTERLLGDQQFSTVSFMAAEINHEVADRLLALATVANDIHPAALGDPAALQTLLEQHPTLQILFNGGTFALRLDGTAVAGAPLPATLPGGNDIGRGFMADALQTERATVNRPVMGQTQEAPMIGISAPIRDPQGQVIGALVGVIDLGTPNFLERMAHNRYGQTGGYLLVAPRYRMIITASDRSRVMEQLPAPGINPSIDRFLQGYEGYAVFTNPLGVEVLGSAKGIPAAGWFVTAALPTQEAFAPIRTMQQHMLLATTVLTLLASSLTWWMLRRQLSPLLAAAKMLSSLSDSTQSAQPLPVTSQDEIGELISSYNRLLIALGQRGAALQEGGQRYRALVEWTPGAVIVHRDGAIVYVNPAALKLFGAGSAQDLVGKPLLDFVHPDFHHIVRARTRRIVSQGGSLPMLEEKCIKLDGSIIDVEIQGISIVFDEEPAVLTFLHDVTERKQTEAALRASEQRFHDLVDSIDGIVWEADATSFTFGYVSKNAEQMLGYAVADWLVPGFWASRIHPPDRERAIQYCTSCSSRLENHEFEYRFKSRGGRLVWLRNIIKVVAENGKPRWLRGLTIDITQQKRAEEELRIAATAFESQEGIFVTDAAGKILRVNQAFTRITGYTAQEAVGQNPRLLSSGRHDAAFYAAMWGRIIRNGSWQGEIWDRKKSGQVYPEGVTISAVKDDAGQVTHYVATFTDITERKLMEDQVRQLAFFDTLTQLPNRRLLNDRLNQAMAASKRSGCYGALIVLDLDNFKPLNDKHGHAAGDLLLIEAADRLKKCVREIDTVARFGGDEFVAILSDLDADHAESRAQAEIVAEKIRIALSEPYHLSIREHGKADTAIEHHCTASIGVALFINHDISPDDILRWADGAMYHAKEAGRNLIRFYDPKA